MTHSPDNAALFTALVRLTNDPDGQRLFAHCQARLDAHMTALISNPCERIAGQAQELKQLLDMRASALEQARRSGGLS